MAEMMLTVHVEDDLGEHISNSIGENGRYESVGEYVRDLIRHDLERVEQERFQALKAELERAYATPLSDYVTVSAQDVIERNRERRRA